MKVDSKYIVPLFDTLKGIIQDVQYSFRECEDVEQCEGVLNYTSDQVFTLIATFTNEHLTPILKPETNLPSFVKVYEKLVNDPPIGRDQSSSESQAVFKSQFYYYMKRKFEKHPIDDIPNDKLQNHILSELAMNDVRYGNYFFTKLAAAAEDVIDVICAEILENRRKYPQLVLSIDKNPHEKSSKKLIDLI
jgi:hypothetical protein